MRRTPYVLRTSLLALAVPLAVPNPTHLPRVSERETVEREKLSPPLFHLIIIGEINASVLRVPYRAALVDCSILIKTGMCGTSTHAPPKERADA